MKLKARLERLERLASLAGGCPGCADRRITLHHEYQLPNGETITLPPFPELPPCTCGRRAKSKVVSIVLKYPGEVESQEAAERKYAEYAAFYRPWQPDGAGLE